MLRKSMNGAWDFVDVSPAGKGEKEKEMGLKGKERRKWRVSEVEVLDLS
jgi:Holliday junction resolvase YEN1